MMKNKQIRHAIIFIINVLNPVQKILQIEKLKYFIILLIMFLIENYSIVTRNQIPNHLQLNSIQQNKQNNLIIYSTIDRKTLLSCHHQTNFCFNLLNKLIINTSSPAVYSQFTPLAQKLNFIKSRFLRLILLRKILAKNSSIYNFTFFIHPITGQHFLKSAQINYPSIQLMKLFVDEYYSYLFPYDLEKIFKQYNNLFISINEFYSQDQYNQGYNQLKGKQNSYIEDDITDVNTYLKKYIMHSPYYSWSVLSNNTRQCLFKQDCISQMKASIDILTKKIVKQSQIINNLTKSNTKSNETVSYIRFNTIQEDLQIKVKYLNPLPQRQHSPFIKNINITKEFLQIIQQKEEVKITTHEGFVVIKINKYPTEYKNQLQYQKELLSYMPQDQFPGLAKYYFVKNFESQVTLYRFSNLSGTITFDKFIKANRSTISLQTKINIFTQIILTLRYIRNSKIVYSNLIPTNIYLKKGQLVRLFDFTNSYAQYCQKITNKIIQKNKLPYVLIKTIKNSDLQKEQKSDMFSFGCLLYQTLFQKDALNIKQSHMRNINSQEFISKLEQKVICIEATDIHRLGMIKLLNYFCLSSYSWKNRSIKHELEDLPFIDWGVVLIKYLQIYLQYKII